MVWGAKSHLEGCFLVTLPYPDQILNGAWAVPHATSLIPLHLGEMVTPERVLWAETWLSLAKPMVVSNGQEKWPKTPQKWLIQDQSRWHNLQKNSSARGGNHFQLTCLLFKGRL